MLKNDEFFEIYMKNLALTFLYEIFIINIGITLGGYFSCLNL